MGSIFDNFWGSAYTDAEEDDEKSRLARDLAVRQQVDLSGIQKSHLLTPSLDRLRKKRVVLASSSPQRKEILSALFPHFDVVPPETEEERSRESDTPVDYVSRVARAKCLEVYERELDRPGVGSDGDETEAGRELGLVIAADTVVCSWTGQILGKPGSKRENATVLKSLRDGPVGRAARRAAGTSEEGIARLGGVPGLEPDADVLRRLKRQYVEVGPGGVRGGSWCRVYTAVAVMKPLDSAVPPGYAEEVAVESTAVLMDSTVSDELIEAYAATGDGLGRAGGFAIRGLGGILVERVEGCADNAMGLPLKATLRLIDTVMEQDEEEGEDEDGGGLF